MFPTHRFTTTLVATLMLGSAVPLMAQTRFVVEGGFHYATAVAGDQGPPQPDAIVVHRDISGVPSFTGGLSIEIPFGGRFRFAPGLRYVQKGDRVRFNASGGFGGSLSISGEYQLALNYLSVPLMFQARPFASQRIALLAGPEVAYLVSSHIKDGSISPSDYAIAQGQIENVDVALEAGAEYAFPIENHEMFLRARYSYGLADISKNSENWSTRGLATVLGMRW